MSNVIDSLPLEFFDEFMSAFFNTAPSEYNGREDEMSPKPLACPWLWAREEEWFNPDSNAWSMGVRWAEKVWNSEAVPVGQGLRIIL